MSHPRRCRGIAFRPTKKYDHRASSSHITIGDVMTRTPLWSVFAILLTSVAARPSLAGNIFDDDWSPPTESIPPLRARVEPKPPVGGPEVKAHPQNKAASDQPTDSRPVTPETAPTTARHAVPKAAEQSAVRKLLKEVFSAQLADRSVAGRQKLAESLLAQSSKSTDEPV